MKREKKSRWFRLLLITVIVILAAVLLFFLLAQQMLFPGQWIRTEDPGPPPLGNIEVWNRRLDNDGTVYAWLIKADASSDSKSPVLVHAHGNGELIHDWPERLRPYTHLGMHLLLVEYRGYGEAGGTPSQNAITDDFIYFLSRLRGRPDVDPNRVVFHGRSLGGGVACSVTHHIEPAALILESSFASISEMAKRFGIPTWLVTQPFDNLACVERYKGPLLLFHGTKDKLIPIAQARQLRDHHRSARLVTLPCRHSNCPVDSRAYWEAIEEFLRTNGILTAKLPKGQSP